MKTNPSAVVGSPGRAAEIATDTRGVPHGSAKPGADPGVFFQALVLALFGPGAVCPADGDCAGTSSGAPGSVYAAFPLEMTGGVQGTLSPVSIGKESAGEGAGFPEPVVDTGGPYAQAFPDEAGRTQKDEPVMPEPSAVAADPSGTGRTRGSPEGASGQAGFSPVRAVPDSLQAPGSGSARATVDVPGKALPEFLQDVLAGHGGTVRIRAAVAPDREPQGVIAEQEAAAGSAPLRAEGRLPGEEATGDVNAELHTAGTETRRGSEEPAGFTATHGGDEILQHGDDNEKAFVRNARELSRSTAPDPERGNVMPGLQADRGLRLPERATAEGSPAASPAEMRLPEKAGARAVEMEIAEPELGKVTVLLTARGSDLNVRFVSQDGRVREALWETRHELFQAMSGKGLNLAGFWVESGWNSTGGGHSAGRDAARPGWVRRSGPDGAEEAKPVLQGRRSGLVDYLV